MNVGEWWNNDTEAVINQALQTGGGPNVSDAYTFNGFPGPLYNSCTGTKGNEHINYGHVSQMLVSSSYWLKLVNNLTT